LIESELFGYRKGAFTGADRDKPGYFQAASGGTLFLDEIGDMPPQTQVKVLRALAERKVSPLGGGGEEEVDIRVVAASNKALDDEVAAGRFREDLYYRLNVIKIDLPPLRDRKGDVPLLAAHFVREFSDEHRKRISSIAPNVFETLSSYSWPGNVRELRNVIEGAVALSDGDQITMNSLPRHFSPEKTVSEVGQGAGTLGLLPDKGVRLDTMLLDMERTYLQQALDRTGGRKTEAARLLGMSFRSFRYRLAKYGMDDTDPNP
jgi:two-component system response regulator PilR (NtrC family)